MEQKKLAKQIVLDRDRMAPWRKNLDQKTIEKIARQEPILLEPLSEHLKTGNMTTVSTVKEHVEKNGPLDQPQKTEGGWDYDLAIKKCSDARHVTIDLQMLLAAKTIHERTAGSVVDKAWLFKNLSAEGIGIVETHESCGLTKVAYQLRDRTEMGNLDPNIWRTVSLVRRIVKRIPDANLRDRVNAIEQAEKAREKLLEIMKYNQIFPAYYSWSAAEKYEWLHGRPNEKGVWDDLPTTAKTLTDYALAEGRDFNSQYAGITMLYDAYRLGRINEPRAIFGELANSIFCVTLNLRSFDDEEYNPSIGERKLSRTAMGSAFYANFDPVNGGFGHISGVNKTHILGLLDTSEQVLETLLKHLLDTYPAIKELTENGKNIPLMLYNKETAEVTFIKK